MTMPFDLKLAPCIWTKLMRQVIAHSRSRGFKIMPYMDDVGCLAATPHVPRPLSQQHATTGGVEAVALFRSLGIEIHKTKGQVTGTRQLDLLGFTIDTMRRLLLLLPNRLRGVFGSAVSLRRH